jgi:protein SCO1/2
MARVQGRTRQLFPDFHLVSFSVDHDTPARLGEYARAHHASPRAWTFLTGTPTAGILHSSQLALIDREGRIRGYYESTEEDEVARLVRDVGWLVNRGR